MNIYTVTPNPALDLSGHVARIVPNEKNYVFAERRDPGGNGINAARIIHRLGGNPVVLGFAGGCVGTEVERLLKDERVPARFTAIRGQTRINVTANNDADHRQTRLTFHGPTVSLAEGRVLLRQIKALKRRGILLVGGSLPQGLPETFHQQLIRSGVARGLGIVVDVPSKFLRHLTSAQRLPPLLLVKPNQNELEEWAGTRFRNEVQILRAARGLLHTLERKGLSALVCVSLAEKGAMLLAGEGAWMGIAPKIRARGTVGAGDSMVGAMVSRLARAGVSTPEDVARLIRASDFDVLKDALSWGIAAGAATAEALGTSLAKPAEIRRLHGQVRIRSLL